MNHQIIPAILTTDKAELEKKLQQVSGLVRRAQVDIMDGIFVQETSISLDDLKGIKHELDLSIHLMVENPADYFAKCKEVGAKRIVFHAKASGDNEELLEQIDSLGLEKGIAISPEVEIAEVLPVKDKVDIFLVMGVVPGKGGQDFLESSLDKVAKLQAVAPEVEIIVDGGVGFDNITRLKEAGADSFVVGSTIFDSDDIPSTIKDLQNKIS